MQPVPINAKKQNPANIDTQPNIILPNTASLIAFIVTRLSAPTARYLPKEFQFLYLLVLNSCSSSTKSALNDKKCTVRFLYNHLPYPAVAQRYATPLALRQLLHRKLIL